jgi:hypothetical protein
VLKVLSKAEREFINKLRVHNGEELVKKEYSIHYVRQFKHRILQKRRLLTDDLVMVNTVLDKLQSL